MFTGIVQGKGTVVSITPHEGGISFVMDLGPLAANVVRGASIALSGVCMTVTDIRETHITFDAMGETCDKTTIGTMQVGDEVNVERSAKVGDEIGGHQVSGHVTGKGYIRALDTTNGNWVVTIAVEPAWMQYILPKGFVAVDGCSLTVVECGADFFTIHLIPETLRVTTFGKKGVEDFVNIELDPQTVAIVETVKRLQESSSMV